MLAVRDLVVELDGWTGRYDLEVPSGALAALVGPSGGGKSTLLHAVAGFERPARGSIRFEGQELTGLKPAARPVAILFQDHNLLPNLDAADNAGLALSPSLRLRPQDRQAIAEALESVGLAGLGARRPSELSGGQRQRVALARALLSRKPVLLLDEPLTGLDPGLRDEMAALVDRLRRERHLTVLMTTHTPEDVQAYADRLVQVADGRVVESTGSQAGAGTALSGLADPS